MDDMMVMMDMMKEMNSKMDMMMKHIGCKGVSKDEYINMSEDEKDMKDEADMKKGM